MQGSFISKTFIGIRGCSFALCWQVSVLQLTMSTCVIVLLANIEQDLSHRCSLDRLGDNDVLSVQNCVA